MLLSRNMFVLASATLTALCPGLSPAQNVSATNISSTPSIDEYPHGALNATAWSLIYTYPLVSFANFAGAALRHVPVNSFYHQRILYGPSASDIAFPNLDTLYSRVVLDLSKQELIPTIPPVESNRYYVLPIYDPYGNAIVEIGSANRNISVKYLIRRAEDVYAAPGYQDADAALQDLGYRGIVNFPSSYGTMLELDPVHKIQNASKLENLTRSQDVNERNPAPELTSLAPNGTLFGIESPAKHLAFAARIVPHSQTPVYADRYRVSSILSTAGLYAETYTHPANLNLTTASALANSTLATLDSQPQALINLGNTWLTQSVGYAGVYGTHYASAAAIAIAGYQQQTPTQALYPYISGEGFSTTHMTLPANQSLLLTFSGKPQLKPTGFWSLSVYDIAGKLIPNEMGRFEVGDRTESLVYQGRNGSSHVYGPNADADRDGSFQVLLQEGSRRPAANWTGNWLPVVREFVFLLRFYVPEPSMTNGEYVYPKVENITAL